MKIDNRFPHHPIHIGRNQMDNDKLLNSSGPYCQWYHLLNLTSCHVVLVRDQNDIVTPEMDRYCANLVRYYTNKYKSDPILDICTTEIRHLTRTPIPGRVELRSCYRVLRHLLNNRL